MLISRYRLYIFLFDSILFYKKINKTLANIGGYVFCNQEKTVKIKHNRSSRFFPG